jgi:hypothetical protein
VYVISVILQVRKHSCWIRYRNDKFLKVQNRETEFESYSNPTTKYQLLLILKIFQTIIDNGNDSFTRQKWNEVLHHPYAGVKDRWSLLPVQLVTRWKVMQWKVNFLIPLPQRQSKKSKGRHIFKICFWVVFAYRERRLHSILIRASYFYLEFWIIFHL